MSKAVRIVEENFSRTLLERKDYILGNKQLAISDLTKQHKISFNSEREIATLEQVNIIVMVTCKSKDDVIPASFFRNFKARINSHLGEIVVNSWSYRNLKESNNQYIYQLTSDLAGMVDQLTVVTFEQIPQDEYTMQCLSGHVQFVNLLRADKRP